MRCGKCGRENMEGARLCQKCGAPLKRAELQTTSMPLWFGSRFIGAIAVAAGVLVMVGVFLAWFKVSIDQGELGTSAVVVSGWDLMTGSEDVEGGAKTYAILAFSGGIVLVLGAIWGFLDPGMKFAWTLAVVGAVLAVVGAAWGWNDLNDFAATWPDVVEISSSHGMGLYLALGGSIAGVLASIVGVLGSPERSIYA